MHVSRVYRLLRLITMLQSGRSYTVAQLAEELQVSRRTVFRDLNMLEMAHVPYYFDKDRQSYQINRHFFLPPVNLTLPEALAMLTAARSAQRSTMLPLADAVAQAALKLESALPSAVREHVGSVMDTLSVRPAPAAGHRGLDAMFNRLVLAVVQRRVCRIVYISFLERKQLSLSVEPHRLAFVGRAWYLLAHSRLHDERRTFKLGRIKRLTVTEQTFPPPAETGEPFGDAWSMIPEGKLHDVRLRFTPKVAGNVAEVGWHHSQQVAWNDDGSMDFTVRVDGLGEIAWWVLGYGDQVKVLAPEELARRVADTARRAAAQYETPLKRGESPSAGPGAEVRP